MSHANFHTIKNGENVYAKAKTSFYNFYDLLLLLQSLHYHISLFTIITDFYLIRDDKNLITTLKKNSNVP